MKLFLLCNLFSFTIISFTYAQQPRTDLIGAFYQHRVELDPKTAECLKDSNWGNCVTIATIKAAIAEFGSVRNVYKSMQDTVGGQQLTFSDGFSLTVSQAELDTAKAKCGFKRDMAYKDYDSIVTLYASICKRAWLKKADYPSKSCLNSFTNAVDFINSGYTTSSAGELLGLKLTKINPSQVKHLRSVIINSGAHTAFATMGIQDDQGVQYKIKSVVVPLMRNPLGLIKSVPITGAYRLER